MLTWWQRLTQLENRIIVSGEFTVYVGNSSPQESDKDVMLLESIFTVTNTPVLKYLAC